MHERKSYHNEKGDKRRRRVRKHRITCVIIILTLINLGMIGYIFHISNTQSEFKSIWSKIRERFLEDESNTDNWELVLVNCWNPISSSYSITLTQLKNGESVDERCYPDLQEMMDDCRSEGLSPFICSSYRTWETQERLYQQEVNRLIAQGYSEEEAKQKAATSNAPPGTSEHQLGLALDIVDINNQNLNESQENTAVQKWLMENSWRYGFILRYPKGKSEITGIIYEPWHYRYVGKEAAKEIYELQICLEEYLERK